MGALLRLPRGIRPMVVALATVALLTAPVSARGLTPDENDALVERIAQFDAAMADGDLETVINIIPPKVMASIADGAGATEAQLRAALIEQTRQAMAAVTIVSFGMDLASAAYEELPDGTPYVTIPTETVLDTGSGKTKVTTRTLALLENGRWYLVRIDDEQQVEILRSVYPQFAGVAFPPGTMEAVE